MRRSGDRNDWWDWGIILLVVAGGTILLWASVWLVHSHFAAQGGGTSTSGVSVAPMRPADGVPSSLMPAVCRPLLRAGCRALHPRRLSGAIAMRRSWGSILSVHNFA
ncbi:MAG TPA: hypothetical protein VH519_14470 [Hyphomicrobiaceae bacterium]